MIGVLSGIMAVGSLLSSHSKRKAQMKAQAADANLQRAKLEMARTRQADDFTTNTQRMREAAQRRELEIEAGKLDAESGFDVAFAGSGISGSSVDEMDAEINAAVVKNKYENLEALDAQLSDMNRQYQQGTENLNMQAEGINTTKPATDVLGDVLKATSAAEKAPELAKLGGGIAAGAVSAYKGIKGLFNSRPSILSGYNRNEPSKSLGLRR